MFPVFLDLIVPTPIPQGGGKGGALIVAGILIAAAAAYFISRTAGKNKK